MSRPIPVTDGIDGPVVGYADTLDGDGRAQLTITDPTFEALTGASVRLFSDGARHSLRPDLRGAYRAFWLKRQLEKAHADFYRAYWPADEDAPPTADSPVFAPTHEPAHDPHPL